MIKAVIFDMDGTLFDTERVYARAWRQAGQEWNMTEEQIDRMIAFCMGRNPRDTRQYFEQNLSGVVTYEAIVEARTRHYDAEIARVGLSFQSGAHELLQYLKQNGFLIALATATRKERTMENLKQSGIEPYFNAIVTGDMVKHGKPHPETFLTAAAQLGVRPAECMGVEDSFNGVRSIHAAGMFTVMVPDTVTPTPEIEALLDARCEHLLEICEIVERINQNGIN